MVGRWTPSLMRLGRLPDDPTGARDGAGRGMADREASHAASAGPSIATRAASTPCRSSPCRNQSVTLAVPVEWQGVVGASRRRRAPARSALRRMVTAPTQPGPRCGPTDGPDGHRLDPRRGQGRDRSLELRRGTPRRRPGWCAGPSPAPAAARVSSSSARSRAFARVRTRSAFSTRPSIDRDDRLDREHRAHRRAGAADPAAALEVLERVERDVQVDVRLALLEHRARSPRRTRPRAASSAPIWASIPYAHRRRPGVDDVDLPVRQHAARRSRADLSVPDRSPETVDADDARPRRASKAASKAA